MISGDLIRPFFVYFTPTRVHRGVNGYLFKTKL